MSEEQATHGVLVPRDIPIRTYYQNHPQAGYIEFSIPVQSPQDVEIYLRDKLLILPIIERLKLHEELTKQATFMWDAFALFVSDPVQARIQLRQDPDIAAWKAAE